MIISIIVAMDDVQEEQMSRAQDAQERPGRYLDKDTD